jgi:hypothetical protein
MGDVAKGIKALKTGMTDEDAADAAKPEAPVKSIDHQPAGEVKRRAETESKVGGSLS